MKLSGVEGDASVKYDSTTLLSADVEVDKSSMKICADVPVFGKKCVGGNL